MLLIEISAWGCQMRNPTYVAKFQQSHLEVGELVARPQNWLYMDMSSSRFMGLLLILEQLAKTQPQFQAAVWSASFLVLVSAHDEPNDALCPLFCMQGTGASCHFRLQARYCQNLHLMLL